MRWLSLWCTLALAVTFALPARATGWPDAEAAFNAQRWTEAADILTALVHERPTDGLAALRLGTALLHLGKLDEAASQLERARTLRAPTGAVLYRHASLLALRGQHDAAFQELDAALAAGLGPATRPDTDPLLAPLRSDPRLAGFLERFRRAVEPCRDDARYRAFDFWLGTWDVRAANAAPDGPASENVITLEHDGCVIVEHWRAIAGGTGSSFNIFDASRSMWFQTWVDSSGGLHEYRGNSDAQGNMAFTGEMPGGPGQPARLATRLTFFRLGPDRVRQFSESSTDEGRTWSTNYDLIYTRRLPAGAAHRR